MTLFDTIFNKKEHSIITHPRAYTLQVIDETLQLPYVNLNLIEAVEACRMYGIHSPLIIKSQSPTGYVTITFYNSDAQYFYVKSSVSPSPKYYHLATSDSPEITQLATTRYFI